MRTLKPKTFKRDFRRGPKGVPPQEMPYDDAGFGPYLGKLVDAWFPSQTAAARATGMDQSLLFKIITKRSRTLPAVDLPRWLNVIRHHKGDPDEFLAQWIAARLEEPARGLFRRRMAAFLVRRKRPRKRPGVVTKVRQHNVA